MASSIRIRFRTPILGKWWLSVCPDVLPDQRSGMRPHDLVITAEFVLLLDDHFSSIKCASSQSHLEILVLANLTNERDPYVTHVN